TGVFLPRLFSLDIPRSLDPAAPNAAVRALQIELYRSPWSRVGINWVTVDAALEIDGTGSPMQSAMVRLLRASDDALLGMSFSVTPTAVRRTHASTNVIGQVSVSAAGVPSTIWGDGATSPVLVNDIAAVLVVTPLTDDVVDPADALALPVDPSNRFNLNIAPGRRISAGALAVTSA
ncbi:MAG: hypothetical protein AAFV29_21510, partial [Myxococcota bacterium]